MPNASSRDWDALASDFVRYRRGERAAADRMFEALRDILSAYFALRVPSQSAAEDLTQAALLKIHVSRDRFDQTRSLKTWVYTVASRLLIDAYRSPDRTVSVEEESLEGLAATVPPVEGQVVAREQLQGVLEHLKPIDRTIVFLYAIEQLTLAEVAAVVGISEGAAKVRAHRSFLKLRTLLT
jgi:RNA polymerase sigma-70 factor (ECF subfamily)